MRPIQEKFHGLSEQEVRVAELIAWGGTRQEMCDRIFISYSTLDSHIQSIYKKLGVKRLNGIASWWWRTTFEVPEEENPFVKKLIAWFFILLMPVSYMASMDNGNDMIRAVRTAGRAGRSGKRNDTIFEL